MDAGTSPMEPGGALPAGPPARKRSRLPFLIGCLVAGPLGCGVCAIGGWLALVGIEEEVEPGDRELVVTVDDLAPYVSGLAVDRDSETLERNRIMGSTTEVHYVYSPDPMGAWYVESSVSYEPTAQDARTVFLGGSLGADVGAAMGGELEDRDDLLSWGDDSRAALIRGPDGQILGNYFAAYSGRRTVSVFFTGVYFDDPEAFREVMEPKLLRLETFRP